MGVSYFSRHHEPNLAESDGISIDGMHCLHRMTLTIAVGSLDEPIYTFYVRDAIMFSFCHHIAMGHRPFQVGNMLI